MANTIYDKLEYLEDTKEQIKQAIVAKGVSVSESDTFRSYADKIGSIETGGGGTGDCSVSACFDDVGYTFVPVYIQEGLETAAQFKAAWNPENTTIDMTGYEDSTVFFPKIDTSNVTTLSLAFNDTSILVFPNNDFPALSDKVEDCFTNTFYNAGRLVSIDFGYIPDYSYVLSRTFYGCNNLERLYIHEDRTNKFKLGDYTFYNCESLSEDASQCNIFDYIDYENASLNYTFYNARIVKDMNFINPAKLSYAFQNASMNNKTITLTYNDLVLGYVGNYFNYAFATQTGLNSNSGCVLKLTGNFTIDTYSNSIMGTVYRSTIPIFDKLDISNFNYTNTSNYTSSSIKSFIDNLMVYEVVGLETFHESYPNLTANKYNSYLISKLLSDNLLKSFPEGVETYWNSHKDNFDWEFGKTNTGILDSLYKIHGTIDLSFLNVQLLATPKNIISNIGEEPDLVIRLDNMDWSGVTSFNDDTLFNSPNVVALYTPFNFDSTNVVKASGLTNWTDHDSLIWSLLTHSTDRTAQSLEVQKIDLSTNSKNALTEDEISQIEAKGYSLV